MEFISGYSSQDDESSLNHDSELECHNTNDTQSATTPDIYTVQQRRALQPPGIDQGPVKVPKVKNTDCGQDSGLDPHKGRVRSFPHVPGQFATHVFMTVDPPPARETGILLRRFLVGMKEFIPNFDVIYGETGEDNESLHLSLSRTVPITSPQIQPLVSALRQSLTKSRLGNPPSIRVGAPASALVNDEGTRTFLTLTATSSHAGERPLLKLIDIVSRVFTRHGLPPYYSNPRLHVSVGWCLGEVSLEGYIQQHEEIVSHISWNVPHPQVICRIGKKDYIVFK